jgi:hypothetical protein
MHVAKPLIAGLHSRFAVAFASSKLFTFIARFDDLSRPRRRERTPTFASSSSALFEASFVSLMCGALSVFRLCVVWKR